MIDTDAPGFGIPIGVIAGLAVFTALFVFTVSSFVLKACRRPVVTGGEAMLGSIGVMLGGGWARVRVVARHGLTLTVEPLINEHID